jgi:hypothetical protein
MTGAISRGALPRSSRIRNAGTSRRSGETTALRMADPSSFAALSISTPPVSPKSTTGCLLERSTAMLR